MPLSKTVSQVRSRLCVAINRLTSRGAGGPFEYWLSRTRHQNLGDGTLVDDCIETLKAGAMPDSLRNLNRAAANFPNGGPKQENGSPEY